MVHDSLPMKKALPIEFTLFENGLDFIWSAVEYLDEGSSNRSLKYAVLHLAAGIELILKERLRRKDWRLLFPDPGKADDHVYQSGAFSSVGAWPAIQRLESECNVRFTDSEKQRLHSIREKRNRIQHLRISDSAPAIVATTAAALEVLIEFIRQELSEKKVTASEDELLNRIRRKLGQLEEFVAIREKTIQPELGKANAVRQCPSCQQEALVVDGGAECRFCGYKAEGSDAASNYATNVLGVTWRSLRKGDEWPVGLCPSCDRESCVETGSDRSDGYVCFHCGDRWAMGHLTECVRCGRWMDDKDECAVCDECWEEYLERD